MNLLVFSDIHFHIMVFTMIFFRQIKGHKQVRSTSDELCLLYSCNTNAAHQYLKKLCFSGVLEYSVCMCVCVCVCVCVCILCVYASYLNLFVPIFSVVVVNKKTCQHYILKPLHAENIT